MDLIANKRKLKNLINFLIFLLGLLLVAHPFIARYLHNQAARTEVQEFRDQSIKIPKTELDRRIELAEAYNSTILPSMNGIVDPFTAKQKEGIREYARMLEINEQIGYIEIPKINISLPIHAGATEEVLQKAAAHLQGTSLPVGGEGTNSVITAHRGLPSAKLFSDLNKMKVGDVFFVHNLRDDLAYKVIETKVIEPSDFESLQIMEGEDRVTLLTCTPYMINSHRLLAIGKRVPYHQGEPADIQKLSETDQWNKWLIAIILLLLLLLILFLKSKSKKKIRH
ncbi:class C sortase [Facklamia miroungae]|uniref:Sortase A n=1 Tax=Facklamia miroungae TaxID=120956 RepID=A0A1G7PCG5_9LACT|nr:class C sortase [Facklamia miroungae]NKZ28662.1 class C sortase [Facklamia miroungae]SDF83958.1 sortase A [Facklamia miroungae]